MRRIIISLLLGLFALPAWAQLPGDPLRIGATPVQGGTSAFCLYIQSNGRLGAQACGTGTATNIQVGTTTVGGGTTGRILYDNGGTLGEMTTTGTGTVLVLQTSPTLITPVLGVATGASVALNGCTLSTNVLCATGTSAFSGLITASAGFIVPASQGVRVGNVALDYSASGQVTVGSAGTLGISSSTNGASAGADTAISRVSAGVMGVGTGTQGSVAGTLQAANFSSGNAAVILASRTTITGGGTGNVPTLTAGPVTGNPTKWLPYDDNGVTRYIPSW